MVNDVVNSQAATALLELMGDISEEIYHAGWMDGIEYRLWELITAPGTAVMAGAASQQNIEQLQILSAAAGGWWYWEEGKGETFITLSDWLKKFEGVSSGAH